MSKKNTHKAKSKEANNKAKKKAPLKNNVIKLEKTSKKKAKKKIKR
ncbi:MAG: hypothetical protein JRE14_03610 [Deltaproteobacteria bacterium]|nr:hypothetical protein [Deltaproteobacteria bacterium]